MSVFVIRHGLSQANNYENIGTPAFGSRDAELMDLGREQARSIPFALLSRYAINSSNVPVATSTLRRTQQTAEEANFLYQKAYSELDNAPISRMELKVLLKAHILPDFALTRARTTLESPPTEGIWFTHALLIAAMCRELGVYTYEPLIPSFCEIRELPI